MRGSSSSLTCGNLVITPDETRFDESGCNRRHKRLRWGEWSDIVLEGEDKFPFSLMILAN
jgi:hypothetical protein